VKSTEYGAHYHEDLFSIPLVHIQQSCTIHQLHYKLATQLLGVWSKCFTC